MDSIFDTSKYLQQLWSILSAFQSQNILCDTTLITSDRELSAHSIVLAAASPVFEVALRDCKDDTSMGYRLEVLGLDGASMELILQLIYSGSKAIDCIDAVDRDVLTTLCITLGMDWLKSDLESR